MSERLTAGQVKRAWRTALRATLRERGFKVGDESLLIRRIDDIEDRLILALRAAGRGETATDLSDIGLAVRHLPTSTRIVAMKGHGPDAPHGPTLTVKLRELVPQDHREWRRLIDRLTVDELDQIDVATAAVTEILDASGEPWWTAHHDPATLLTALRAWPRQHALAVNESIIVLGRQLGDDEAVEEALGLYEAELRRRGPSPLLDGRRRLPAAVGALR